MKKTLTCIITIATLAVAHADESEFLIELKSPVKTLRIGQTAMLNISISGSGVQEITSDTEGIDANSWSRSSFVHKINFRPQRTGSHLLGPYTVSINGQKLTSNQVEINVLPKYEGDDGTFFQVDTNEITLGEPVELVMETCSKDRINFRSLFLGRDNSFSSENGGNFSSTSISNNIYAYYNKTSWLIYPKKSGEFQITKELFSKFPEDLPFPDFTIKVLEKE